MKIKQILFLGLVWVCMVRCTHQAPGTAGHTRSRTLLIQPFAAFPPSSVESLRKKFSSVFDSIVVLPVSQMPAASFYAPRQRYRADTLIRILKKNVPADAVVLGLTSNDISVTKDDKPDWGVMGLGYQPGRSCVVSTYRLKGRAENLFKVAIHELGHTEGLPHCKVSSCIMRDAEGGFPLEKETGFCTRCKKYLLSKNWNLGTN